MTLKKKACEYIIHCKKFLKEGFGTGSRRFIYEVLGCTAVKSNNKNIEDLYDLKSILEEIEKSIKNLSELLHDPGP
ncbi:MAG: hypothetical protein MRQ09_00640 [Candidatus Midichloria sp.]|nr:hypothetical protein [Candidatus Midichloria sp.]